MAEEQNGAEATVEIVVELDLELLDFDDLPRILEIVAVSEDPEIKVSGRQMLDFINMVRGAITSDTSGLNMGHWRVVLAEFGQHLRTIMNPVDEETGKN